MNQIERQCRRPGLFSFFSTLTTSLIIGAVGFVAFTMSLALEKLG